ncbi:MAG TPA: hypothetical protein VFC26_11660 [Verrucomicrobiae bacterium]|nr:hypothetical protein [Verrucomicrobiae bacterium]
MIGIAHRAAVNLCDDVAATQASFMGGRIFRHVMDKDALKVAGERQFSPCENVQIANDSAGECFGCLARKASRLDFNLATAATVLMHHVESAALGLFAAGKVASARGTTVSKRSEIASIIHASA